MSVEQIIGRLREASAGAVHVAGAAENVEYYAKRIAADALAKEGPDAIRALVGDDWDLTREAADAAGGDVGTIRDAVHDAHETMLKDREADRILAGGIPQHPLVFGTGPAARHILTNCETRADRVGVMLSGSLGTRGIAGRRLAGRYTDVDGYPIPLADCPPTAKDKFDYHQIERGSGVRGYLIGDDFDDVFTHKANDRPTPFIIGSRVIDDEVDARDALGQYKEIVKDARFKAWIRKHRDRPGAGGWGAKIDVGKVLLRNLMPITWPDDRTTYAVYEYGKTYFESAAGDHCVERTRDSGDVDRYARVNVTPARFIEARNASKTDGGDPGWQVGNPYEESA